MKKLNLKILVLLLISIVVLVGCSVESVPEDTSENTPVNVAPWKGATHNGFSAGQDLTEEIKSKSPHGVSKLDGVPIVGRLED